MTLTKHGRLKNDETSPLKMFADVDSRLFA